MLGALKAVRVGERSNFAAGFATLFGLVGSHAILETARDALFLGSIPASRLPWVYLAIAAVSMVITQLQVHATVRLRGRAALSSSILISAAITFGFWILLPSMGAAGLYALYIWSGVLTALVVVQFWALLADIFTITQAKRLYGFIGAGSVAGAIAGSALASGLSRLVPAQSLLLIAAVGLFATALAPVAFRGTGEPQDGAAAHRVGVLEAGRYVFASTYSRRVAMLVVIGAATVTLADYIFKSMVAASVPPQALASYFATVYLILNILSLAAQLFLVGWLLRNFSVLAALGILPALLLLGSGGLLIFGGLGAALAIKGVDGSLRYSLSRTARELLYVPMTERMRRRVKTVIDVVAERFGKALISLAILGIVALGAGPRSLAVGLTVLATLWLVGVGRVYGPYLQLFRRRLGRDRIRHLENFPELDIASLETVIAALDSAEDAEVIAALDMLEIEGKSHLVPPLILHHPSPEVVVRALDLFAASRRESAVPLMKRYLEHPSPRVRSAIIGTLSVLELDAQLLRERLSHEESAAVRSTIMVNLIAAGEIVGSEARDTLLSICEHGSVEARRSLAEAIGRRRAAGFEEPLLRLAEAAEAEVRVVATVAMGQIRSSGFLPSLIRLLGHERTRGEARRALYAYGDQGLEALSEALESRELDDLLRWQIPRSIAMFPPHRAAGILLRHLPYEWEGMVRFRIIRSLTALRRRNPNLELDGRLIQRVIRDTVSRAYRYLDRRLILERGAAEVPRRATEGHGVLVDMLRDKYVHALDRIFRLLGLAHPREDFAEIYSGLQRPEPQLRSSSIELLDNLLSPPLRGAIRGLVDDVPDPQRLDEGRDFHTPLRAGYEEILEQMLGSMSASVQDLTAYHVAELRLTGLLPTLSSLPAEARARGDVARAIAVLERAGEQGVRRAE